MLKAPFYRLGAFQVSCTSPVPNPLSGIDSLAHRPFSFSSAYNASKAALHHYSDTLRVELSPFGVRVINLITGGVKSELARVDSALPSGSYYSAVSQEFKGRITLAQRLGVRSEVYAKDVVDKVIARSLWSRFWSLFGLGGPRTWIWAGSNVLEVWLASSFLPRAVLVSTESHPLSF